MKGGTKHTAHQRLPRHVQQVYLTKRRTRKPTDDPEKSGGGICRGVRLRSNQYFKVLGGGEGEVPRTSRDAMTLPAKGHWKWQV